MNRQETLDEIARLKELYSQLNAKQMSIKNVINSIYGVFLSKYFYFFNKDIGMSITKTGQSITKTTGKMIQNYFYNKWHLDKHLHKKMGVYNVKPITKDPWVYSDTDSAFITMEEVFESCEGWEGTKTDFILAIYNNRLENYFKQCFDLYVSKLGEGAENTLNLEPEKIAASAMWFAKKAYSLNITWKMGKGGGKYFENLTNITKTGIAAVKRTSPPFVRKKFTQVLYHIFEQGKGLKINQTMKLINSIKEEFMLLDIEEKCGTVGINKYSELIIDDTSDIVIAPRCLPPIRGSAYHNHLLHKNPKYKSKYNFIKDGDKVKVYDVLVDVNRKKPQNKLLDTFAYIPGEYPIEFAPPIDDESQFNKYFIIPFNKVITSIGHNKITSNLILDKNIF